MVSSGAGWMLPRCYGEIAQQDLRRLTDQSDLPAQFGQTRLELSAMRGTGGG
jgi:hypothetical protein